MICFADVDFCDQGVGQSDQERNAEFAEDVCDLDNAKVCVLAVCEQAEVKACADDALPCFGARKEDRYGDEQRDIDASCETDTQGDYWPVEGQYQAHKDRAGDGDVGDPVEICDPVDSSGEERYQYKRLGRGVFFAGDDEGDQCEPRKVTHVHRGLYDGQQQGGQREAY